VTMLLRAGAKPNIVVSGGGGWQGLWSPLMIVTFNGHTSTAELLLNHGADVNYADENGWTPLIWACSCGHPEVIGLLHERGCDVDFVDVNGWTGLTWCCFNGHEESIEKMVKTCLALPSPVAEDGRTPLMFLASMGLSFGVHLLLVAGADPDVRQNEKMIEGQSGAGCVKGRSTKGGWTALMRAAEKGHLGVVRELMGRAQIDQRDDYGATALMHACTSGASTCAFALLKAGADKDAVDYYGETALMRSVKKMQSTSVRLLVSEGADSNRIGPPKAGVGAVDEAHMGWTPLMWAIERESTELVRLLLEPSLVAHAHAHDVMADRTSAHSWNAADPQGLMHPLTIEALAGRSTVDEIKQLVADGVELVGRHHAVVSALHESSIEAHHKLHRRQQSANTLKMELTQVGKLSILREMLSHAPRLPPIPNVSRLPSAVIASTSSAVNFVSHEVSDVALELSHSAKNLAHGATLLAVPGVSRSASQGSGGSRSATRERSRDNSLVPSAAASMISHLGAAITARMGHLRTGSRGGSASPRGQPSSPLSQGPTSSNRSVRETGNAQSGFV